MLTLLFAALFFLSQNAPPKEIPLEFGEASELKGLVKVYVQTNDLEARKQIVKELAKEPRIVVVGVKDDCEFKLFYASGSQTNGATLSPFGSIRANNLHIGELGAVVRGRKQDDGRYASRVLWSSRKSQQWAGGITLSRNPAINAAREFLKVWRKENPKP